MRNISKLALTAAFGLALAFTFNCSSGKYTEGDGDGGGGGSGYVNADNEAWVSTWEIKGNDPHQGFIYKQNGEGFELESYDGKIWCIDYIVTYSISENQLTWCRIRDDDVGDQCFTSSYSISGNTLTVIDRGRSYTFTRKSDVNIAGNCH